METWEVYDKIDEQLKEKLLTIPPYLIITDDKLKELLNCLENPNDETEGLEGEVIRMINNPKQRAFQMEYRIKPSKIFDDSLKIIESAIFDFMIGNYISSYVCLIPVIETVLRNWAEELDGIVTSTNNSGFERSTFIDNLVIYLNNKKDDIEEEPTFKEWISRHIQHFEYIIKDIFYQRFKNSETGVKNEFNRNRTLHLSGGLENSIIVRNNNIRIFLLIDVIAELYISLDSECYHENTYDIHTETNTDFNLRKSIYLKNLSDCTTMHTDMSIIRSSFLEDEENLILSEEKKLEFLEQINLGIQQRKMAGNSKSKSVE